MRFGSFVFPVSHVPENDGAVIDRTLEEIELQESLGFEAAWLTEHHFDGASAFRRSRCVWCGRRGPHDPNQDRVRGRGDGISSPRPARGSDGPPR